MNEEIIQIVERARQAQLRNRMITPDDIDPSASVLAGIIYDEGLEGFVARKDTYQYREELKKAGFLWLSEKKLWLKPIHRSGADRRCHR